MSVRRSRPRSTIVPGRILIPRMVYAEAGIRNNDSYLDEPTVRSQRSTRSTTSIVGSRRSVGSNGSMRRSRGREEMEDRPIFDDDFDAPEDPVAVAEVNIVVKVEQEVEDVPVSKEVSFAINNRPKRNRRPPCRYWLLERPKYNFDKEFIGMEKPVVEERSLRSTKTRKRAAKRSAPEKKIEKKSVKSKKSTKKAKK